jgi:hypothetical protein
MTRIDSQHWQISTGRHFQNGHHNTAQIQQCPISMPFHMWVDYDVPTSKNSTGRHFQNGRHNTAQIQHCSISTSWIDSRHQKISNGLHFQWSFYSMENFNHIYILTYEWFIECCLNPLMQTDTSFIYVLFISCSVLISGFENLKYGNNNL